MNVVSNYLSSTDKLSIVIRYYFSVFGCISVRYINTKALQLALVYARSNLKFNTPRDNPDYPRVKSQCLINAITVFH